MSSSAPSSPNNDESLWDAGLAVVAAGALSFFVEGFLAKMSSSLSSSNSEDAAADLGFGPSFEVVFVTGLMCASGAFALATGFRAPNKSAPSSSGSSNNCAFAALPRIPPLPNKSSSALLSPNSPPPPNKSLELTPFIPAAAGFGTVVTVGFEAKLLEFSNRFLDPAPVLDGKADAAVVAVLALPELDVALSESVASSKRLSSFASPNNEEKD